MSRHHQTSGSGVTRIGYPSPSLGFLAATRIEPAHVLRARAERRSWWRAFACGFLGCAALVALGLAL